MSASPLTVAILAGGAATRLGGRDKGLETLLDAPLIARVARVWASYDLLIVANRNLDEYARYARTISDAVAGFAGPLAGVAAALAACATERLVTVPVDCPDPPRDLIARLAVAIETGAAACVAHDGERRQPLFALYRRELAERANAAAKAGQGVWQWQDTIPAREVDFSDRRHEFHNLNTPDDFAAYADALRSRD